MNGFFWRSFFCAAVVAVAAAAVPARGGGQPEAGRAPSMRITFPAERAVLPPVTNCYVIGAAETGMAATLNGTPIPLWRTGAFLAMAPVKPGPNKLTLRQGGYEVVRKFNVLEPKPEKKKAKAQALPPRPPRDVYADLKLPRDTPMRRRLAGKQPGDMLVVVDAGHGSNDVGALSPRGYAEKDLNLLQALAMRDSLRAAGFKVKMTRADDSFPALYDRPKFACAAKADAFVSVHHNATAADRNPRDARHTVAYGWNAEGMELAAALQRRIAPAVAPVRDLGALSNSLAVCRNPMVPSCLLEIDFINLPEGEEASLDPARRRRVADAVAEGMKDWLAAPDAAAKPEAAK